ncbi:unnamed protein product [Symbiodinium sp. CCMP2456]|nr:unnamed protein product [Symbiodinium sp. CCMP2456]
MAHQDAPDWSPLTVPSVSPASAAGVAGAAPTTPPWLLGRDAPQAALPDAPHCAVCQTAVLPHGEGDESRFPWPRCGHLRGSYGREPTGAPLPYVQGRLAPRSRGALQTACHSEHVSLPPPAVEHNTVSAQHQATDDAAWEVDCSSFGRLVAVADGRSLRPGEAHLLQSLHRETLSLPTATFVHLVWACQRLTLPGGYIPASAQEAILQSSLGHQQASNLVQSLDHLRLHTADSAAPRPPATDASPAEGRQLREAFTGLDAYDACAVLRQPCHTFRMPPAFVKGPLRQAMHFSVTHILQAQAASREAERAWKLWLFLPRMLLHRPAGAPRLPKSELRERFDRFVRGDWAGILQESSSSATFAAETQRAPRSESAARADRAVHLAHLGELSAARQALITAPLAPGDATTLEALRDPARRPSEHPLTPTSCSGHPKGAAPGPSGYTADIMRPLLDDTAGVEALHGVAELLARAELPASAASALGLGRLVALSKPAGGVRGIVVGDFLWRLVARSLAQQFAPAFEAATNPHQFALSTRAGSEALVHSLQAACDGDAAKSRVPCEFRITSQQGAP